MTPSEGGSGGHLARRCRATLASTQQRSTIIAAASRPLRHPTGRSSGMSTIIWKPTRTMRRAPIVTRLPPSTVRWRPSPSAPPSSRAAASRTIQVWRSGWSPTSNTGRSARQQESTSGPTEPRRSPVTTRSADPFTWRHRVAASRRQPTTPLATSSRSPMRRSASPPLTSTTPSGGRRRKPPRRESRPTPGIPPLMASASSTTRAAATESRLITPTTC